MEGDTTISSLKMLRVNYFNNHKKWKADVFLQELQKRLAAFLMNKEGTDDAEGIQEYRFLDCRKYPGHAKILQLTHVPYVHVSRSRNHNGVNGGRFHCPHFCGFVL